MSVDVTWPPAEPVVEEAEVRAAMSWADSIAQHHTRSNEEVRKIKILVEALRRFIP